MRKATAGPGALRLAGTCRVLSVWALLTFPPFRERQLVRWAPRPWSTAACAAFTRDALRGCLGPHVGAQLALNARLQTCAVQHVGHRPRVAI